MDVFSNLVMIGECLLDVRRTTAFERAIAQTVKKNDVVLDVGTGSGIMAMFAARTGAKKVFAVEIAPDIVPITRKNVAANHLENRIEVINNPAQDLTLPEKVDVVIMELLDTGLIAEQQAVVLNALRNNGIITANTTLIPCRYQCACELVDYDFSFYGFQMPCIIQARNFAVEKRIQHALSPISIYDDINFSETINTKVDVRFDIPIEQNGKCNALVLKSRTFLSSEIKLWGTSDMNMPVIIPLTPRVVKKGTTQSITIQYEMSEGFSSFNAAFTQA